MSPKCTFSDSRPSVGSSKSVSPESYLLPFSFAQQIRFSDNLTCTRCHWNFLQDLLKEEGMERLTYSVHQTHTACGPHIRNRLFTASFLPQGPLRSQRHWTKRWLLLEGDFSNMGPLPGDMTSSRAGHDVGFSHYPLWVFLYKVFNLSGLVSSCMEERLH